MAKSKKSSKKSIKISKKSLKTLKKYQSKKKNKLLKKSKVSNRISWLPCCFTQTWGFTCRRRYVVEYLKAYCSNKFFRKCYKF